jgi:hypothetical protein
MRYSEQIILAYEIFSLIIFSFLILFYTPILNAQVWNQVVKMNSSDAEVGDNFGYSVSIYDDRAIVGSDFKDSAFIDTGGVYILELIDDVLDTNSPANV